MFFPKRSTTIQEYNYLADELNESLGVTNNTKAIVRFFKDICSDCLKIASDVPISTSPLFDLVLCNFHEERQLKYSYTHIFNFTIPKSHNTLIWLDDNSEVTIICNNYNSESDRKKDRLHGKGSAASSYKFINDSSSKAVFAFEFSFIKNGIVNGFYVDNQWFVNMNAFEYGFQHEINHVHKEINDVDMKPPIYMSYYKYIQSMYTNDDVSDEIYELSFIFYVFCIPDERNAYIEQFYSQYKALNKRNKDYKNTDQWKVSEKYLKYLNEKRQELIKQSDDIYKYFNKSTEFFLKIKTKKMNSIKFTNVLIDKMIECIKLSQKKYIRTTFIPESYYYTDYGRLLMQEKLIL